MQVDQVVEVWLCWVLCWELVIYCGRVVLCCWCFGFLIFLVVGIGVNILYGVQYGFFMCIKMIVDYVVVEYIVWNLLMLQWEFDQQVVCNCVCSYWLMEDLDFEFDGLFFDFEFVFGVLFLFMIVGLVDDFVVELFVLLLLIEEVKVVLCQEVVFVDEYVNMVGCEICGILL